MVKLVHHGAAATSDRNLVDWKGKDFIYASHAIVNIANRATVQLANGNQEEVFHVYETLRTDTTPFESYRHVITSLCHVQGNSEGQAIVCGFSDGTVNLWTRQLGEVKWTERVLASPTEEKHRSITSIDAIWVDELTILVAAGSSGGADLYTCTDSVSRENLCNFAVSALRLRKDSSMGITILLGTAAPRHNKIHIYHQIDLNSPRRYGGALPGHEDWITSLAWTNTTDPDVSLLATASQDARIRLWKFKTLSANVAPEVEGVEKSAPEDGLEDDEDHFVEEDDEQGDARLQLVHDNKHATNVHLEALLMGHEDHVTSVKFHPNPQPLYGREYVLISSSMDRIILLWCSGDDGIWSPLSRVGSAGGILGGSVGCSLLGYCQVVVEPTKGNLLVGHAYGGSIHAWSADDSALNDVSPEERKLLSTEDRASLIRWQSAPCVTGHFNGVVDICWESDSGDYLLTVSGDQTMRLWSALSCDTGKIWVELARPQVHGYDLSAVASISTEQHKHLLVSGADEKEVRVFDATKTTIRTLRATVGLDAKDSIERVDRAYLPSLGLTNKASAVDGLEEDKGEANDDQDIENAAIEKFHLPRERDLGAVSLWPEVQKLFGHDTELYCLASNVGACSSIDSRGDISKVIVASSCKARDSDNAAIRLWDAVGGKCLQVLSSHKSTVATLAFSPDSNYLLSSGKDRRLSLWQRDGEGKFQLAWAKDSAHKRIIWSVHFCPFDSSVAISSSRDGCVRVWKIKNEEQTVMEELHCFAPSHQVNGKPDSVNAVSFAPVKVDDMMLVALGLESGFIELWKVSESKSPCLCQAFDANLCHIATVTKLAWRPTRADATTLTLASSSLDHGVRIYEIDVTEL